MHKCFICCCYDMFVFICVCSQTLYKLYECVVRVFAYKYAV